MKISKETMLGALPVWGQEIVIRAWTRADTGVRAGWPSYPGAYAALSFALAWAAQDEPDAHFAARNTTPNRVGLAVDHGEQPVIGLIVLSYG